MKSKASRKFWACFDKLAPHQKKQAHKAYLLWRDDPYHPSLHFRKVGTKYPVYSARINDDYRTVGLYYKVDDEIVWFWIGPHHEYEEIIKNL